MSSWITKKLDDVAEFTNGGAWNQIEYVKSGIPVVRVSDISDRTISLDACKYLPLESLEKYKKHILFEGDLIIATVGSHPTQPASVVGKAATIPNHAKGALLNQNAVRIRPKSDLLDKGYLRYLGHSQFFRDYIISHARGSANQVRISIIALKEMDVPLPPHPTQRKIAAILSAYDDLIENNTRRIKILEEMAQMLYREWFVHFRFPGHEKVRMWDSPLGRIPEGWEVVPVRDISRYINRGISPKYDEESNGIVINQKCIRDGTLKLEPSRRHSNKVPNDKFVQFGDILINSTGVGTLGRVAQIYLELPNCTVDSHVSIVRPGNKVTIDYFGFNLINQQDHFDSLGTGSTGQAELNRDSIANTDFLLPSKSLQFQFSSIVEPIRKSMIVMQNKNTNLRHTRDLLLSKIIPGDIDISELKITDRGCKA